MSNSRFATADAAFQYDPSANYEYATFQNLSIKKCQSIASLLHVCSVKKYKKEELIPLILHKHVEQFSSRLVETEDYEGTTEIKGNTEGVIASKSLSLNDQMKKKLNEINKFFFNEVFWFQASSVAECLEYENTKKAVIDHVNEHDKIRFSEIPSNMIAVSCLQKNFHPQTLFINENGVYDLLQRSRMPIITGKKRSIEEIYVATNRRYENENIYKIGRSENSISRVKGMNTSVIPSDDMYLCYVSQCYDSFLVEKIIHNLLEDYRICKNREFFKLSFEEIKNTVDEICGCFNC